ncbi:HAD family phosphatase [Nocardia sp. CC227C]|uniref:HAD family hydrolase n=1 Tax=Nocardia sp. CC227C TaxID=3044562 RepID=UPI00278C0E06|nr:HAD family phosphatase [Nocardia sp. CC227C]
MIFDIGGVLEVTEVMDFDIEWEQRLGLERGRILGRLADVRPAGSIGTITESAFRDAIIERLEIEPRTADELIADIWRQYLGVANDELIAYAKTLRPAYRTGIISNSFVGAREREQRSYGFEDLVDDIIYSHEIGIAKPDPRIYAMACDRLAVDPQQVVFIDDAQIALDGAAAAGMTTIHHTDNATTITTLKTLLHNAKR